MSTIAGTAMLFGDARIPERFWGLCEVTSGGCWTYIGSLSTKGYGNYYDPRTKKVVTAHRLTYQVACGPLAVGEQLDHLCHTSDLSCSGGSRDVHRRCVNPAHLEPVRRRENILRGRGPTAENARKTVCRYGHPYDEVNTLIRPDNGYRNCRACKRLGKKRFALAPTN